MNYKHVIAFLGSKQQKDYASTADRWYHSPAGNVWSTEVQNAFNIRQNGVVFANWNCSYYGRRVSLYKVGKTAFHPDVSTDRYFTKGADGNADKAFWISPESIQRDGLTQQDVNKVLEFVYSSGEASGVGINEII